MVVQACKLNLPHSQPSSLEVTSFLFEPHSNSLALMHSDSSILLLPFLSPFPSPSSPPAPPSSPQPQTLIPPLSTSSCFFRLHTNHVLFVVAGPHDGESKTLLRFWILNKKTKIFSKTQLQSNQKDLISDQKLGGVVAGLTHGVSVKLYGSVNFFALYSVSTRKIWIFSAKALAVADEVKEEDVVSVKLMKCAVIDCTAPICSVVFSAGYLLLGENNGVRILPLRPLVKGGARKQGRRREKGGQNSALEEKAEVSSNGKNELKNVSVKLRTVKLKHDSSIDGAFFVAFSNPEVQNQRSVAVLSLSSKAVSIHVLSQSSFLVLDSVGDVHLLSLYSSAPGSETTGQMRCLSHSMKVQLLAVLPDISARTQTVCLSDGFYSIHVMSVSDMEVSGNEDDQSKDGEESLRLSVMQAIFSSEKIHDLIPLSANTILVLGQGNVFAYAIS